MINTCTVQETVEVTTIGQEDSIIEHIVKMVSSCKANLNQMISSPLVIAIGKKATSKINFAIDFCREVHDNIKNLTSKLRF